MNIVLATQVVACFLPLRLIQFELLSRPRSDGYSHFLSQSCWTMVVRVFNPRPSIDFGDARAIVDVGQLGEPCPGGARLMTLLRKPDRFLNIRVHDLNLRPGLTGLCVGYELEKWRASQFAQHILEWIPEFALKHSEMQDINSGNAVQLIRNAAKRVYKSKKFENRGEFGELFLHAAIREAFDSVPAISKIFYKTAPNETVKGFDAVHVVGPPNNLELWLGEAKFYSDINSAVKEVVVELQAHTNTDYLRGEFLLIRGKIDPKWPHAAALEELLSENKSLDEVFSRACIAVLLTYDSRCLTQHVRCDAAYAAAFETEIRQHYATFAGKNLPQNLDIHLFLLPLNTKEVLLKCLDEKLKAWQKI